MNWLEFANPSGFWWFALAIPISALYFLRVRLRRQSVSTLLFWDKVFESSKPKAWWQSLHHWPSLLLQLLLLAILATAISDPLWNWQTRQHRKLMLVVDNSASMNSRGTSGSSRFEEAIRTATSLARSLRSGDEMAVITAGGQPRLAMGCTPHAQSIVQALAAVKPTDAPGCIESSLKLASRLLSKEPGSKILLLTDGCDPASQSISTNDGIEVLEFGEPQANLAITRFQVRRSLQDALGYQILIEVSNFSDEPVQCEIDLLLDGTLQDVLPFDLKAGESKLHFSDQASQAGGVLEAVLKKEDSLVADNQAVAILPNRFSTSVTLVSRGSLFLRSILESLPLVQLSTTDVNSVDVQDTASQVTIFHQVLPSQLPPGRILVIQPTTDCDLWTTGSEIAQPIVSKVYPESPLNRHVKLENAVFPNARQFEFRVPAENLISTSNDEPLLCRIARPSGDILILNVDLDQGDIPLRIAFPILMKNIIEWFSNFDSQLQPAFATGSSATIDMAQQTSVAESNSTSSSSGSNSSRQEFSIADGQPPWELTPQRLNQTQGKELWIRDPLGRILPLNQSKHRATVTDLNHCGLWIVGPKTSLTSIEEVQPKPSFDSREPSSTIPTIDANPQNALVPLAVNLCNRDESNLRPKQRIRQLSPFVAELRVSSIWSWLAVAAILLLSIEWWLYQRRVIE